MSRRSTVVTITLTAVVAFLVGAIVAGGFARPAVVAEGGGPHVAAAHAAAVRNTTAAPGPLVNFADVVERVNPAVVNIDATSSGSAGGRRRTPVPPVT